MNSSTATSPAPRPIKSLCSSGQSGGGRGTGTNAEEKELQRAYGAQVAQTAIQSVGLSTRNFGGPFTSPPEYALAVSIIFTKATEAGGTFIRDKESGKLTPTDDVSEVRRQK